MAYSADDIISLVDQVDDIIDGFMDNEELEEEFCFDGSDDELSDLEKWGNNLTGINIINKYNKYKYFLYKHY